MSETTNKKRTSGHVELTDELIEELAEEAERGYDTSKLRERKRGRPPMGSRAASVFQVRLDPELMEALDERAAADDTTRSEITRRALRSYLSTDQRG